MKFGFLLWINDNLVKRDNSFEVEVISFSEFLDGRFVLFLLLYCGEGFFYLLEDVLSVLFGYYSDDIVFVNVENIV